MPRSNEVLAAAELALGLARVDGIAPVVARPVGDERDEQRYDERSRSCARERVEDVNTMWRFEIVRSLLELTAYVSPARLDWPLVERFAVIVT